MYEHEQGELAVAGPPAPVSHEVPSLVREMGRAYVQTVRFYRTQLKRTLEEADWETRELTAYDTEQVPEAPADQVSWMGLGRLMEHDPDQGRAVWERVRAEAWDELASGHRAAKGMEWDGSPWDRARFLAIRAAFRDEWRPRGGIEDALIDTMAQAHTAYLTWLGILQVRTQIDVKRADYHVRKYNHWEPQRLDEAAAVEQAIGMADRFNKLFLRTLRALRDLRRYGPVIVQNPAQVNIGAQQINTVQRQAGSAPDNESGAGAEV